jgi:uncharacterized protein (TIGR03435 family)
MIFKSRGRGRLETERFQIDSTLPPDTTKAQLRVMFQNLLAERFKLTLHRETKELPVYSLVVGKNGPKVKEAAEAPVPKGDNAPAPTPPPAGKGKDEPGFDADGFPNLANFPKGRVWNFSVTGHSRISGQQVSMQALANELTLRLSRPVTDETGLKANYDFILTFLIVRIEWAGEPSCGRRQPQP